MKRKKWIIYLVAGIIAFEAMMCATFIIGCKIFVDFVEFQGKRFVDFLDSKIKHFEDWIKITDDGFKYYYNENNDEGAYILDIPDFEDLTIPEYVGGRKVVKLGHERSDFTPRRYVIIGDNTKKLTIQHQFAIDYDFYGKFVHFPNLTNLTFIDFLYCNQSYEENELIVPYYIGKESTNVPTVELKKSDREYSLNDFKAKVIIIPDYVEKIDAGVFDGLTDVTIKTSYETKPEGWADGWNGSCEVEWGSAIKLKGGFYD